MEVETGSGTLKRYVLRKKPPGKLLQSAHAVEREFQVNFIYFLNYTIFFLFEFYFIECKASILDLVATNQK